MYNRLINCAVVGLGMGEQHVFALLQDPNCRIGNIVELDESKARNFIDKNQLKDTQICSFEEVVQDNHTDFISVASFDNYHYDQVIASLRNNKHVFVEKPLCQTREQLNKIHLEWKRKKCGLASNLVLRKAPLYVWLKDIIDQDQLGEIYAFDGDYLYGRVHKVTEGWRKNVDSYSVMQGGGIHMIDLMLWLINQKPTFVTSCKNKIVTRDTGFRNHDFHGATFFFENGLIGRITANFGCVHRHQHVLRIFGTKGTFIYDDMGARIHWNRDEASQPEFINYAPKPKQKGTLIHDLLGAISSEDILPLAQREFDLMSVVLAADEALLVSQPLKIEYLTS